MDMVKVSEIRATDSDGQKEEVRASVVESVLAGVRAAQLSAAELCALVAAIQYAVTAQETVASAVMVSATAMTGYPVQVSSRAVIVTAPQAEAIARTVEKMVRWASPVLWAELEQVLDATDQELAEYGRAVHQS